MSRKIVAGLFVSLDGVTETPDKWTGPYFIPEVGMAIGQLIGAGDTMLLGRVTYETFAEAFTGAKADDPVATGMTNTPKYVVSTTLDKVEWANSQLITDNFVEEISKLKEQDGANINISGSITLVRWLLFQGLLDELDLMVFPLVVGSGQKLFNEGDPEVPMKLDRSEIFPNGVLHLTYTRA